MALWQIRTRIRDEPGTLAKLAGALTRLHANIVSVDIHSADIAGFRRGVTPSSGQAHDDLYVEVPEQLDADTLRNGLPRQTTAEDLDRTRVRKARAEELMDGPSRALDLTARLAGDPAALPDLLCRLIGGDRADLSPVRPPDSPHLVVVAVPWHRAAGRDAALGQYVVVSRAWAPFSLTERTRADRFVAAAAAIESERIKSGTRAVLADGTEIRVQLGTHNDKGHVGDLVERCVPPLPPRRVPEQTGGNPLASVDDEQGGWIDALVTPPGGFTVLAYAGKSTLAGMAQCLPDDKPGRSEVAVLVADAWRRRGVGTLLLRHVVRQALTLGIGELVAITTVGNATLDRLFARAGVTVSSRSAGDVRELRVLLHVPEPRLPLAGRDILAPENG